MMLHSKNNKTTVFWIKTSKVRNILAIKLTNVHSPKYNMLITIKKSPHTLIEVWRTRGRLLFLLADDEAATFDESTHIHRPISCPGRILSIDLKSRCISFKRIPSLSLLRSSAGAKLHPSFLGSH
jgi:hypothetical protein